DLDRIDTSYEVLRDFIMEYAPQLMDDDRHRRRLAALRDQERFFWREQVVIGDPECAAVLAEAAVTIDMIDRCWGWQAWPRTFQEDRGYKSCS
ncbi:MAG: hypothetical protein GWN58_12875, partial [Anaerolineae bacterium]|nr:hypothetical protein [Thermoplasmata archaeon]NIV30344.1 hypothetical protein [Anaerolineae bacterium]NIY05615.1 hypothetical protein [Thermoplasmata archaeon]